MKGYIVGLYTGQCWWAPLNEARFWASLGYTAIDETNPNIRLLSWDE